MSIAHTSGVIQAMVDDQMALTFSVRNNPGTYALLLGSGVSSEAEIPTGWGILKDLILKVAAVKDDNPDDPIEWYEDKYDEEPGYDDILEQLAQSQEERQTLLEPYFEPTDEEREEGVKTPSDAHRSIAWLVDEGYINVIITTNFDRLLEKALEDRGVTPTRISTAAAAKGATPLRHEDAVILKINGDYKETNIKNTSTELDDYEPAIRNRIDEVFDEYGLIVCGWSGKWDAALRNAMLECESRRYSTYWAYHSALENEAEELVEHRDGTAIQIDGATQFFSELKENVQALENAETGAPLTRDIARERVKRYMTREKRRIDLADLVQDETEHARTRVFDQKNFPLDIDYTGDALEERCESYIEAVETLVIMCSTCAYWGPKVANPAIPQMAGAVRRLGTLPRIDGSYDRRWAGLRKLPGVALIYAIGVPAVQSGNWELIREVLVGTEVATSSSTSPVVVQLNAARIGGEIQVGRLTDETIFVKKQIKSGIREPLRDLVVDDERYEDLFARFELIADMILYDRMEVSDSRFNPFVPEGTYWQDTLDELEEDVSAAGEEWGPLQAGLFEGSSDRVEDILDEFDITSGML